MQPRRPRLVDSTLREGEQFGSARFTSDERIEIARALDAFGVEAIELVSPAASPRAAADLRRIAGLGLSAKVLTHGRCHEDDVALAADCGAQGVNLFFGTSELLRRHGHRRGLAEIAAAAGRSIRALRGRGLEVRFSCEDAFRTPLGDVMRVLLAAEAEGVDRVGLADTVGTATPQDVQRVVGAVRAAVACDIEFHGHDDTGCAVANAHAAWRAGATHLDVTVLGIGERNGICPLAGWMARLWADDPALTEGYRLELLPELDRRVARAVGVEVPFNACITGSAAFTHKAGVHTGAVLREPRTYEALDPASFGRRRSVLVAHALTGRAALRRRADELGLTLDARAARGAQARVKALADARTISPTELDAILRDAAASSREEVTT